MAKKTPRRSTARVGFSRSLPASARRVLAGSVDSSRVYGDTIQPASDGRLETVVRNGGGLKLTSQGLEIDGTLGDKNRDSMPPIDDLDQTIAGPSTAEVQAISDKVDVILQALRDTGRLRAI